MSLFDYQIARRLVAEDVPFDALIMAALQRADTANAMLLRASFPWLCTEAQARYDAPGGLLPTDSVESNGSVR